MTGSELRERRLAAGVSGPHVAHMTRISAERLRVIEHEREVDDETARRILDAIQLTVGLRRRLARQLIEAASGAMRTAV